MSISDQSTILRIQGRVQTTDATATTCGSYTLPDECAAALRVIIIGIKSGSTDCVVYHIVAAAEGQSGTRALIGTPTNVTGSESTFEDAGIGGSTTWTVDVSGNDVRVRVTGIAATTIDWQTTMEIILFKP